MPTTQLSVQSWVAQLLLRMALPTQCQRALCQALHAAEVRVHRALQVLALGRVSETLVHPDTFSMGQ